MAKKASVHQYKSNTKKRKGIHSKTKSSKLKNSKNYFKKYIGQGR
jgi:hypothetical protein